MTEKLNMCIFQNCQYLFNLMAMSYSMRYIMRYHMTIAMRYHMRYVMRYRMEDVISHQDIT